MEENPNNQITENVIEIRKKVEGGFTELSEEEKKFFMDRYGMTPEKFMEWKQSLEKYRDNPKENPMYYIHPPLKVLEEEGFI